MPDQSYDNLFSDVDDELILEQQKDIFPDPVTPVPDQPELSPSQQEVVDHFPTFLMNDEKEMTISGFAGSGKSFLVEYLADMGQKQMKLIKLIDPRIPVRKLFFTATTNKAAEVLRNFLDLEEVSTIHSLLGLKVENDYATGKQKLLIKGTAPDLNESLLFIDEASMIDAELLDYIRLCTSRYRDCKIIFIGDSYQLPPVMEDISPVFNRAPNTFFLREIQRQAAGSPIIQLSNKYRELLDHPENEWPDIVNQGTHIIYYPEEKKDDFFMAIKDRFTRKHAANDYRVLAWSNARVREYNSWIRKIQGMTQPYHIHENVLTNKPLFYKKTILAPTDSIHNIRSVSNTVVDGIPGFWIQLDGFYTEQFFQPANWVQADQLAKKFATDKNWKAYFNIREEWADFRPVHASTVHKSQGSTYDEVFIDMYNIGNNTQWREVARLAYVAISRAKYTAHILGNIHFNYTKKPLENPMEGFGDVDSE